MATTSPPRPEAARPALPWRIAWLVLLGLIALAAIVLQLDRASETRPGFARLVPDSMRGFSGYVMAASGVQAGDPGAYGHAVRLLRWYPVPSENLTALAGAAAQRDDEAQAIGAVSLAAARGWRDPIAQRTMYEAAVQSGEWRIAADRLGALWVSGEQEAQTAELLPLLLRTPDGRAAFLRKLETMPLLRENFATWSAVNVQSPELAMLFAGAHEHGVSFDCADLSRAASYFARFGKAEEAAMAWSGKCAAGSDRTGTSLAFSSDEGEVGGPFDWTYPDRAGLTRSLHQQGGRQVMDYEFRDPLTAVLAQKYTRLTPGRHVLRLVSEPVEPAAGRRPGLRVLCLDGTKRGVPLDTYREQGDALHFTVPNEGCAVQLVRIVVSRGSAKGLRLERAGRDAPG
jgi:hypothetical protein